MYAIIRTGGKQYKVAKDDVITVEKIPGEAGQTGELDEVLTIDGKSYIVIQRAWQVVKGSASAYIRVEAFGPS